MKKILFLILLVNILVLSGCRKNEECFEPYLVDAGLSVLLGDISNSIEKSKATIYPITIEYNTYNIYIDETKEKHTIVNTNIGPIEADYQMTKQNVGQYYYTYEYTDLNQNTFSVMNNGRIVNYYWYNVEKSTIEKEEDEILKIANDFFIKNGDINDYTITINHENEKYIVKYVKYIDEIESADSATISIDKYGNLEYFVSTFLGMIKKDTSIGVPMDEINNRVLEQLDEIYIDSKKEYDDITYESIKYRYIMVDDNNCGIECYATVNASKNIDGGSLSTSDKVKFIIMEIYYFNDCPCG